MTDEERKVASALKNLSKVSKRAGKRLSDAREKLGDSCTHPEKHVTTYRWEHDNGYGRQKWLEGLFCNLCLRRKPWKTMGRWN